MAYENSGPGISFQPGNQQGRSALNPVQQAVQLLSLRLPTVVGARALAPQALLTAPGGQALGGSGSPDATLELLRRLMQQSQAAPTLPQMPQAAPVAMLPQAQPPQTPMLPQAQLPARRPSNTFSGSMGNERDLSRPYLPPYAPQPTPQPSSPIPMPLVTPGDVERTYAPATPPTAKELYGETASGGQVSPLSQRKSFWDFGE